MVKFKVFIFFVFVIFLLIGCEKTTYKREFVITESKSYEASLFRQNCAICHGQEANGKEINGKQIPSLRYGDAANRTEEEIYNQIAFGKLPMPAFKNQLTETDIRRMVKFVRHDLQGKD